MSGRRGNRADPTAVRAAKAGGLARAEAVATLAARQHGVVSHGQLVSLGFSRSGVARWRASGRLRPVHPGVFAVGHDHLDTIATLHAALLYAGEGAALSHTTAAWWWGLIDSSPQRVHVSVARRSRALPLVAVHHPRSLILVEHRGFAVTRVGRTLVDLAALVPLHVVRKALANAAFRDLLSSDEARQALRRGRHGSRKLRLALDQELPELAKTLSPLEDEFLELCAVAGLPLPLVNEVVVGLKVDAYWPEHGLVVELDGRRAHGNEIAVDVDRARDLRLRAAGLVPVRYSGSQVRRDPHEVVADVRRQLSALAN